MLMIGLDFNLTGISFNGKKSHGMKICWRMFPDRLRKPHRGFDRTTEANVLRFVSLELPRKTRKNHGLKKSFIFGLSRRCWLIFELFFLGEFLHHTPENLRKIACVQHIANSDKDVGGQRITASSFTGASVGGLEKALELPSIRRILGM